MPWLYLLGLSVIILIVWWALSRSAETSIGPGESTQEHETEEEPAAHPEEDEPEEPVK